VSLQLPIQPGAHTYVGLPVTTLASGLELALPVHIIAGEEPGPTLGLTAGTHGDAISGPKWIKAVLDSLDPSDLKGTLVAVPAGNPPAFEWDNRNTPIDGLNMNRVYPGDACGQLTEQLASTVAELVLGFDVHVDCHGGGEDAINYMYAKPSGGANATYDARNLDLARAFGMEYLWEGAFYAGSLTDFAYRHGIAGLLLELGLPEPYGQQQLADGVTGVHNLLKQLGMLGGEVAWRRTQWLLHERKLVRPTNGGLFVPEVGHELLNGVVPAGTVLGRVIDPGTLEEIESLTAPYKQTVILQMRHQVSRVQPGSYSYILANRSNAERLDNA
jgi:predicted deacylase